MPMMGYFWWEGSRRTYAVGFEERSSLESMAVELRRLVTEVSLVNGLSGPKTVDLVAHSMGGIVCRLAMEDEETRHRIRRFVTLGTPHSGTHAARFLATQSALALRPESSLLERLDRQLPWPGPPLWPQTTAYWSRSDIVLLPPEAAKMEGALSPELETMTHYGYLLHPDGWRAVYETLYDRVTKPKGLPKV